MRWLRSRSTAARDGGFTLVEILVSMVLLAVVLGLTSGLVIRALDHNSYVVQQTQAQERNNVGMELATRLIRQAVFPKGGDKSNSSIVTVASPTQIVFTSRFAGTGAAVANPANQPVQRFVIQLNGTSLQWGSANQISCASNPCTYGTPTASKTIVTGVRNAGGSSVCPNNTGDGAVFHYWYLNASGALTAWTSGVQALTDISVVQVTLWTQTQTGPQRPTCVPLTDYVQLRNWQ